MSDIANDIASRADAIVSLYVRGMNGDVAAMRAYLSLTVSGENSVASGFGEAIGRVEAATNIKSDATFLLLSKCAELPLAPSSLLGIKVECITDVVQRWSGIYFLCDAGEVVYVGQSVDVLSRVKNHRRGVETKVFDAVYFLAASPQELDKIEGALIRWLKPRLNGRRDNGIFHTNSKASEDDANILALLFGSKQASH